MLLSLFLHFQLGFTSAARIKLEPQLAFGEFQLGDERHERQERRLEDTGRHYNAGYVEYKSEIVEEKRVDQNGDEEEIDEYVVIESR